MNNEFNIGYTFLNQTPGQFLEHTLSILFGPNSMSIKAMDLVCKEMCLESGFERDDGTDYYNHPIDVANTLISFDFKDEDIICAALLHDIIEDIPGYTHITITEMFNSHIADLVLLLTKEKGVDYTKEENIKKYLEEISHDMYASAIKTADRMHNMMTLSEKTFKSKYNKSLETEQYYLPFFKFCRKAYPRYKDLFYFARTQIQPLILEIKSFYMENERLGKENEILKIEIEKWKTGNERLKKEILKLKKTSPN